MMTCHRGYVAAEVILRRFKSAGWLMGSQARSLMASQWRFLSAMNSGWDPISPIDLPFAAFPTCRQKPSEAPLFFGQHRRQELHDELIAIDAKTRDDSIDSWRHVGCVTEFLAQVWI
jgi:hypothetical protein